MVIPLEELLKNEDSHYKLVLLAARRANELSKGSPPLIVTKSKKPAIVALEEIAKGKVKLEESKEGKVKKS
jgi:DNA-directed RNA polymerase subunit omega